MSEVPPLMIVQARAEARALLYAACEIDNLDEALRPLLQYALESGITDEIGDERAFAIIRKAFNGVAQI